MLLRTLLLTFSTAALLTLTGCAASNWEATLTVSVGESEGSAECEVEVENEDETQGLGRFAKLFGGRNQPSDFSEDLYMRLTGTNVDVPDQQVTLSVIVRHDGSIVGADTFPADLEGGEVRPTSPSQVHRYKGGSVSSTT